ncbi:hypothetical protein [Lentilactobacillus kisonensis]|uniref:hypothetical protein n=1 Tax=Lentilactobacillus kisonensis TaxID=481722 RepID=UPI001FB53978|nr:hypothetical protein [Lentilactobacillus kisonensis]
MLLLKMVSGVLRIPIFRPSKGGSLTVVAVIFTGILLTCLVFQCVSYNKEISTISEITNNYRNKRLTRHPHKQRSHFHDEKLQMPGTRMMCVLL